jgi:transposase InsO family protein
MTMCRVLHVSRSGYYQWRDRTSAGGGGGGGGPRAQRRGAVVERIREVFEESRGTYGSPRVAAELKGTDVKVSENTVAKYMRQAGLRVTPKKRFTPRTTDSHHGHPVAANVLGRDFAADAPNRKWVCDMTYVWTDEGWLYLSVVLDCFSRRIVGWSMTDHMRADESVGEALRMAITRNRPAAAGLVHHSDRGSQYACDLYRGLLAEHRITCSMSRPGNCYDNAVAESFFGSFKTELVHRTRYATRAAARASVFEWIECWYNRRRRHSSLGYLSPEAFEAQTI